MKRLWYIIALCSAGFASPSRAGDAPLPDVATVLEKVLDQAKQERTNDLAFRSRYAWVRTKTKRELDSKGLVKKEETKQSRNTPTVHPSGYVPPSPSPASTSPNVNSRQTPQAGQGKPYEKSDFALNEDLVSRYEFTLVKREQINGRDALLVDFKPANKKLPVHGLKDRFLNKAAGTVWIDEADSVFAKIDVHLTENVNVVGGLVGALKKFNYTCERARTEDGLWYSNEIRWRLEGREVFSHKILEYEENRSEVKKVQ